MALPAQNKFTDALRRFQLYRVTAVWLIVFLGGASAAAALPKQKHAEEAEALFERGRTLSELEVEGGTPFRLEAMVYVRVAEQVAEGRHVRVWQSQHRWRDELTFPRYSKLPIPFAYVFEFPI
jgi:hypothetical protein